MLNPGGEQVKVFKNLFLFSLEDIYVFSLMIKIVELTAGQISCTAGAACQTAKPGCVLL